MRNAALFTILLSVVGVLRAERLGLDYYLYYLRGVKDRGCTTVDEISLIYFRNDREIGKESLRDGSCDLEIYFHDGKMDHSERTPAQVSRAQYEAIVPPRELERKLVATGAP